jgi:hypothetical protein
MTGHAAQSAVRLPAVRIFGNRNSANFVQSAARHPFGRISQQNNTIITIHPGLCRPVVLTGFRKNKHFGVFSAFLLHKCGFPALAENAIIRHASCLVILSVAKTLLDIFWKMDSSLRSAEPALRASEGLRTACGNGCRFSAEPRNG